MRSGEVGLLLGENEEQGKKGTMKWGVGMEGGAKVCSYTVVND